MAEAAQCDGKLVFHRFWGDLQLGGDLFVRQEVLAAHAVYLPAFFGQNGHNGLYTLADVFLEEGCDTIQFEFRDCGGARDGIFSLDDVDSASIDDEYPDDQIADSDSAGDESSSTFSSIAE